MTPTEARHFLETCNDQIEAGMTPELRRRILQADDIVAADRQARLAADAARCREAIRAARQARANA
jgi:hypothetical protein